MLKGYPSKTKAVIFTATAILLFLAAQQLYSSPSEPSWRVTDGQPVTPGEPGEQAASPAEKAEGLDDSGLLPCQKLPGADDVVVVMRTGATEIQDKLPIHFNTTFRCYRDLIIFSDFEEIFNGYQVHDVLGSVDQGLKESNRDFEIYNRLQNHGHEGLHDDELSGKSSFEGSKSGKNDNPGWRLDKWKFLPMMNETLKIRPDKKWYVFVESDSYAVWSNLLQWLEKLDHTKDLYYGSEVQIGPDIFAHGGSVFIMTRSAIQKGAEIYAEKQDFWHQWTGGHWAGDCVLGKALLEAGVPLIWSWPMFQGGHPEKMDFTEKKGPDKKLWCTPALSYHHLAGPEFTRLWQFEQNWIQTRLDKVIQERSWFAADDYSNVLEHRKVFKEFVWPNITAGQTGFWDNLSPTPIPDSAGVNFEGCHQMCEEHGDCLQFSSSRDSCSLSSREVMLGNPSTDVKSGWMLDRIEKWMEDLDKCKGFEGWSVT